jgi:threonine dehydratase
MICKVDLSAIVQAESQIRPVARVTPIIDSERLSKKFGAPVWLKLENLQRTGSFKIRGAYYKLKKLAAEGQVKHVMAISAGNHAQGVALAGQLTGISSTVFMPADAPLAKVQATRNYGAEVICIGKSFDETKEYAMQWLEENPVTFISPFDDDDIITGQGSCGLEIFSQLPSVETVIVPVGGGGLLSGIAIALKALKPSIRLIGVQAKASSSLVESFKRKKLIQIPSAPTIADGIAIKKPAQRNFEILSKFVDEMMFVSEEELSDALYFAIQYKHMIAEGAGVAGLAALLSGKIAPQGPTLVVLSGGNIDVKLLDSIINKGMMRAGRFLTFKTLIADAPGSLKKVLNLLAQQKANVLHIEHARFRSEIPLGTTQIEVELETRDHAHANEIIAALEDKSYRVQRL